VEVASEVPASGVPIVLWWAWVGVVVQATWEAGVALVSIGVDEVYFGHLVAVGGWEPSKKCQRFPSLLELPDFWPWAMVEKKGQPLTVKEFTKVGMKEEKG